MRENGLEKIKKGLDMLEEVRVLNIRTLTLKEKQTIDEPDMRDYSTLELFTKGLKLIKEGMEIVGIYNGKRGTR